jgi:hypothetical protein
MKNYNQQIEAAYVRSKRQGDLMRDRSIERSSGQDRKNRFREDLFHYAAHYEPQHGDALDDSQRVDRYSYERAMFQQFRGRGTQRSDYPMTYRGALAGYMSEHVGNDLGREDYNRHPKQDGNLFGNTYGLHRGKGPKNYKRSDDRILEDIVNKLTDDPNVDASDIDVQVRSGEVTLSGKVNSRNEKRHAEDLVGSMSGVSHVENRVKVKAD